MFGSRSNRFRSWFAAVFLFALCLGSCSSHEERRPVFPVRGQVFVQKRPAAGALVVFRPVAAVEGEKGWPQGFPHGSVADDGTFFLGTYGETDGAPAGDYVVLIRWASPTVNEEEEADRLQGRYYHPATSPLRARVEPKPTELAAFQLP